MFKRNQWTKGGTRLNLLESIVLGATSANTEPKSNPSTEDKMMGSQGINPFEPNQYAPTIKLHERDPYTKGPILTSRIIFDHETTGTAGYGRYGIPPGTVITEEDADQFLVEDITKKLKVVSDLIPGFKDMPFELRDALLQSAYRGGITGSPKTMDLINRGEYKKAAKEFLDHDGYRRAKENKQYKGIAPRMEKLRDALLKYAE